MLFIKIYPNKFTKFLPLFCIFTTKFFIVTQRYVK